MPPPNKENAPGPTPSSLEELFAQQPELARELRMAKPLLADFYTQPQLAEELGVTQRTLQRWQELRVGPPMIVISRRMRIYSRESVRRWLLAREPKPRNQRRGQ